MVAELIGQSKNKRCYLSLVPLSIISQGNYTEV